MTDFIVEDFDFDSVPDASEFRPFPTGAYRVKLVGKADSSEEDGVTKKFINVQAELLEIVETSAEENLPKAGDITGQRRIRSLDAQENCSPHRRGYRSDWFAGILASNQRRNWRLARCFGCERKAEHL